jgi:hypothetical protein
MKEEILEILIWARMNKEKRESVLFIGTQYSNLYTAVDTPAEAAWFTSEGLRIPPHLRRRRCVVVVDISDLAGVSTEVIIM